MKRFCLIGLLLVLSASVSFAGDIQVSCEPGLRIYLDDEFIGVSSAKEDGLFLMDIDRGKHTVWIEKDGFLSQRFRVEIFDLPIEVKVAEFQPIPTTVKEEPPAPPILQQQVGSLVVTSAPQKCTVEIDGKIETFGKRTDSEQVGTGAAGVEFIRPFG